jgi:hypothetical protein
MNSRTSLAIVAALLVACTGDYAQVELGAKDGHGLPPTDLERVATGTEAPDFSLQALSGDVVTLSEFRDDKNVVLVFYRGHW